MRRFLLFCFLACLVVTRVSAQALPVTPMQNAVSGAMQEKMIARGFAANDPRFGATLAKSSTALAGVAGTATAVTVGTVTAPGWASLALAIGLGAVITYAVQLGLDALTNWLFRSDGKIDESGQPLDVPTSTSMTVGGPYWKLVFRSAGVDIELAGGDGEALARQGHSEYLSQTNQQPRSVNCTSSASLVTCSPVAANRYPSGAPGSCPAGHMLKSGTCTAYSFLAPSAIPPKTAQTLQTAINDLPAVDKNKALNPVIVAALADQAWKRAAAQPDYDGLPYLANDPITAPDAARWQAANPDAWPTVQDFVNPQATPSGGTSATPYVLPNTSSPTTSYSPGATQSPSTNPSTQPLTNLGPDPGIGSPSLEVTPTAQQILEPILGLLPDVRAFSMPSYSGVCPTPSMELWGKHLVLDGHCTLLDNNRSTIQAVMAVVWVALALFIILTA